MKTIGKKLKKARIERGVIQRRMAKDLGLSVQSVLNVENGKCLKVATLERIAEYLGVEIKVSITENEIITKILEWIRCNIDDYTRENSEEKIELTHDFDSAFRKEFEAKL